MAHVQVPSSTKKRERSARKSFDLALVPTPTTQTKKHPQWAPEPSPDQWETIKTQEFTTPADQSLPLSLLTISEQQPATGSLGGKRSKHKSLERTVLPRPLFDQDEDTNSSGSNVGSGSLSGLKKAVCVQALFASDDSSACASPREAVQTPRATPSRISLHIGDACFSPAKPATVIRTRPYKLLDTDEDRSTPPLFARPLSIEPASDDRSIARIDAFPLGSYGDRSSFNDRDSFSVRRGSLSVCPERDSFSVSRNPRESAKFDNMDFHEYDYHEDVADPIEVPGVDFDCVTPSPQITHFDWDNAPQLMRSPSSTRNFADPMRSPLGSYRGTLRSPRMSMTDEFPGSPRSVRFSCTFRNIKDTPGPKHVERQKSGSLLSLVPEMDAFQEKEHLQKITPQTMVKKKKEPPPTPLPHRLSRQNSLFDDKILAMNFKALTMDASAVESNSHGRIFATEFSNQRQVGSGAFFDVFRVEQRRKSRTFAIKRSKRPFRSKRDRSEYLREIQMVSGMTPHPNIIIYYRAWQEDLHFLIQMEYCHSNLSDFVSGRTLSERFLWDCFQQIAQGLSHVHQAGLIHLDIKPENILVDLKGQRVHPVYKLGDFGQARLDAQWADGSEGDCQYVAPEVISKGKGGADPTAAADIFSLGLLMFELSSRYALPKNGDLWHDLRSGSASQELPIAMAKIQCSELKSLIMRCLEPNPTERISADAIVQIALTHLAKREAGHHC